MKPFGLALIIISMIAALPCCDTEPLSKFTTQESDAGGSGSEVKGETGGDTNQPAATSLDTEPESRADDGTDSTSDDTTDSAAISDTETAGTDQDTMTNGDTGTETETETASGSSSESSVVCADLISCKSSPGSCSSPLECWRVPKCDDWLCTTWEEACFLELGCPEQCAAGKSYPPVPVKCLEDQCSTLSEGCCSARCPCSQSGQICIYPETGVARGVCKSSLDLGKEECWSSETCDEGEICQGVVVCPCGAQCLRADQQGSCE